MGSWFINSHLNKSSTVLSVKIEFIRGFKVISIDIFANEKIFEYLHIFFKINPEGSIICFYKTNLSFGFISPFSWIITPISLPLMRSPRISALNYSSKISVAIVNFSDCYYWISVPSNKFELLVLWIISDDCSRHNMTVMISFIYHVPCIFSVSCHFFFRVSKSRCKSKISKSFMR